MVQWTELLVSEQQIEAMPDLRALSALWTESSVSLSADTSEISQRPSVMYIHQTFLFAGNPSNLRIAKTKGYFSGLLRP